MKIKRIYIKLALFAYALMIAVAVISTSYYWIGK